MSGFSGGWDEKFLQQESELKRVRSEKTNLEQHILGMESELETLQEERTRLRTEVEAQKKLCSGMEQKIETLSIEVSQNQVCQLGRSIMGHVLINHDCFLLLSRRHS